MYVSKKELSEVVSQVNKEFEAQKKTIDELRELVDLLLAAGRSKKTTKNKS